jgi:hypothetical protein
MGVRALTASVSVISVRISSSANTRISEVTFRPVWGWEQWLPPSQWSLWGSHPPGTRGSQRLPAVLYGSESGNGLCLRDLCENLILCKHVDLRGYLPSCMGVRAVPPSPWSLWGSHPPQTRGSQRLPAVLYGGESGDGLCLRDLCEDLILRKHTDLRGYLLSCMRVRAVKACVKISPSANRRISEVTCRPVWGCERCLRLHDLCEDLILREHANLGGYLPSCMGVRAVTAPSPWSLWESHPPRTPRYQRLPAVLYGGKSSDGLRLRDLCKDLILCEHADLRGYLPFCMGVRAVTASVSVISVRISSSANTGISEITCRPVWEWERWRPLSPWSLWGSHPPRTQGSQRLPAVLYGSESGDGLCLRDLCKDLILPEHEDRRGSLPSCMWVRAVTASISVISIRISSSANTRLRGYLPSCMGVRAVTASVSVISVRISSSANTRISKSSEPAISSFFPSCWE